MRYRLYHRPRPIWVRALLLSSLWMAGVWLSGFRDNPIAPAAAEEAGFTPSIQLWSGDCRTCHTIETPGLSHPVGVKPSMPVPDHLPLANGRITCATCHVSESLEAHADARTQHTALLRENLGAGTFCNQCHQYTPGKKAYHSEVTGIAHLNWGDNQADDLRSLTVSRASGVDSVTRECMSCHDGTAAADIGNSHPVGIAYAQDMARVSRRQSKILLTPVNALDPRIRLFDGKVGCGSCHSPYSTLDKMLAMPNRRSELCTACHNMP